MLPELRTALENDYPFVLGGSWENHLGNNNSGWEPIIRELAEKISEPLEAWWIGLGGKRRESFIKPPRVTRLAVETGGLRVYMTYIPKDLDAEITKAINHAEQKSFQVCELCSQPGSLRLEDFDGEIATLCDDCYGETDDLANWDQFDLFVDNDSALDDEEYLP